MVRLLIVLTSVCITSSALAWSSFRNNGQHFLSASMQPEVVAKTLSTVEHEWKSEAAQFIRCDASELKAGSAKYCDAYTKTFDKSCATVVSAIAQGSNGDKAVTKEYMVDICSQNIISSWQRDMCIQLARDLTRHMTASTYENRNNFQAKDVCDVFWSRYVAEQKAAHQKELDAIKAAEAEKQKEIVRSEANAQNKVVGGRVESNKVLQYNKVLRSKVEKQKKATIQGEWDKGIIQGDLLLWKTHETFDGLPVPLAEELFNRTATSVEMKLWNENHNHSKLYKANLQDGKLLWSNGDVWMREAGEAAAKHTKNEKKVATEQTSKEKEVAAEQSMEFEAAKEQHMKKEAELQNLRKNLKMDTSMEKTRLKQEEEQVQAVEAAAKEKIEEATQVEEGKVMKKAYDILARAEAADMPEPKIVNKTKQPLKADDVRHVADASPAQPREKTLQAAMKTPPKAQSVEPVAASKA